MYVLIQIRFSRNIHYESSLIPTPLTESKTIRPILSFLKPIRPNLMRIAIINTICTGSCGPNINTKSLECSCH